MDLGWIIAVSGFALLMAGTPGPNNTLLIAAGANYGFRGTVPYLLGTGLGVAMIFLFVTAVGSTLMADPRVHDIMKWLGLAYMLWLALVIARADPLPANAETTKSSQAKPPGWIQGVLFQFVNPKLWMMIVGALATYGGAVRQETPLSIAVAFGLIFGLATLAGCSVWAFSGAYIARFLATRRRMRLFNWTMAGLLLASVLPAILR